MAKVDGKSCFKGKSIFARFLKKKRARFAEIHAYTNTYLRKLLENSKYPKELLSENHELINVDMLREIASGLNTQKKYPEYFYNTVRKNGKNYTTYAPMLSHTLAMMLLPEIEDHLPLGHVKERLGMTDDEYGQFVWYIIHGKPKDNNIFKKWNEGRKHNKAMRFYCNQGSVGNDHTADGLRHINWQSNTVIKSEYLPALLRAASFYRKIRNLNVRNTRNSLNDDSDIAPPRPAKKYTWPPHHPGESMVLEIAWEDFAIDRIPMGILRGNNPERGSVHFAYYEGTIIRYVCYPTVLDGGRVVIINYPNDEDNTDEDCYCGTTVICFSDSIYKKCPSIKSIYWKFADHDERTEDVMPLHKKSFYSLELHYAHWIKL